MFCSLNSHFKVNNVFIAYSGILDFVWIFKKINSKMLLFMFISQKILINHLWILSRREKISSHTNQLKVQWIDHNKVNCYFLLFSKMRMARYGWGWSYLLYSILFVRIKCNLRLWFCSDVVSREKSEKNEINRNSLVDL